MYTSIIDAIHRELANLDDKFANGAQMNGGDLEMFDKMVHALKCLATYEAMDEANSRNRSRNDRDRYYRRY